MTGFLVIVSPAMATYRYHCSECGKTYIGEPNPGLKCNCNPAKTMIGSPYIAPPAPLSPQLLVQLKIEDANALRAKLCKDWDIKNFSHKTHGSNFSGSQTVVQLINNIVEKLDGQTREDVKAHVIQDYQYDIDTKSMT